MIGKGVHKSYKETAKNGGDVLWHVTIKGRKELTKGIRLHMSLKVFDDKKEMNLEEIKEKVAHFQIKKPQPEKLKFSTTIFTSERDGTKYYMLLIDGSDDAYKDFYESLKHCGTVYKKFMPHITIDKDLYDQINKEGLKPSEIEFEDLTVEAGAGNTIHDFMKSENFLSIMRETAFYTDLRNSMVLSLPNSVFKNWLDDNQERMMEIISKHEERVKFHFGTDEIAKYAIQHGVIKAYEYLRKNSG